MKKYMLTAVAAAASLGARCVARPVHRVHATYFRRTSAALLAALYFCRSACHPACRRCTSTRTQCGQLSSR
eukprot:COSAG02_NODE_356_length_23978_cov_7.868504_4_plen_71_part_00